MRFVQSRAVPALGEQDLRRLPTDNYFARIVCGAVLILALATLLPLSSFAQTDPATAPIAGAEQKTIRVPRLSSPPRLSDFEGMRASGAAGAMVEVSGFTQQRPSDGVAATQETDVYMGYDSSHLYVGWVCFDDPAKVSAHMSNRENFGNDDWVELTVDTFHDQRHGFIFESNAVGIQADALWSEPGNADFSFDTVWDSGGKVTSRGYIVLMAIPFRSLRFPDSGTQTWGFTLQRSINRKNESDYWPAVSSRISGRLNQAGVLGGIEGISPARNYQFNPYGEFQNFRVLDLTDPNNPAFSQRNAQFKGGVDSKFVLHNSLVLDTTVNPDFSQIESDQPQITVNQRFPVFFPEKRPFFMENSNLFEPNGLDNNLVFTRNIVNPEFGARLTGKAGPYTIALLAADDRAPGYSVVPTDPAFHKRAYFAIAHVTRELGQQSNAGVIYTDREFMGGWNRVGGIDGLWKIDSNWSLAYRGVLSSTQVPGGAYSAGSFGQFHLFRQGRQFGYDLSYDDISPGFQSQTGFISRTDIRHVITDVSYSFRPEGKHLISWTPQYWDDATYDHKGTLVEYQVNPGLSFELSHQTYINASYWFERDTLRPQDFAGLTRNVNFSQNVANINISSTPSRRLHFFVGVNDGGQINVVPPSGLMPVLANAFGVNSSITVKPIDRLEIDNTYILDRVSANSGRNAAFNNDIIRSKWNYQFTPRLSLRFIAQYNSLLANPTYTSLRSAKEMNYDFLVTYLVHPGTAAYVGFNDDRQNLNPALCMRLAGGMCDPANPGLLRTTDSFLNDGRIFYIKVSYLFRP